METETLDVNKAIRRIREQKKLSGAALCRKAGGLDPRTLTAIEKGRIKNPSIQTLEAVARGLEVSVSEIFREAESGMSRFFSQGTQKGMCQMDFPSLGAKIVSFTPLIKDFFCGKLILGPHKKLDQELLHEARPIFISVMVGRCEVSIEGKSFVLKEGDNLYFNGILKHTFYNPLERESVLLLVTSPSFV